MRSSKEAGDERVYIGRRWRDDSLLGIVTLPLDS